MADHLDRPGVEDDGDRGAGDRCEPGLDRPGLGVAGADDEGIEAAGTEDHLGVAVEHPLSDIVGAEEADHARGCAHGGAGGEDAGTRVLARAGDDPDHPAGVLVGLRAGARELGGEVLWGEEFGDGGLGGEPETDVDDMDRPGEPG